MTGVGRKLRTENLQELKSATTTMVRVLRAAAEKQALFSLLWQEAHPNLKANSIKLEQITSAAEILAFDIEGMGSEFLAAGQTTLEVAQALKLVSAAITENVQLLIQAEEEPASVLDDIEEAVQFAIGQTLRLAALATGPQIDAGYIKAIIVWAQPEAIDAALDDMLPGQLKYLADKINPRLKGGVDV